MEAENKSLKRQTLGGILWLGGVKVSQAVLQFGIVAILARLLTPSDFGLMGLALIVVSFSDIFTDLGFGPAITQKKELSETDIYTGFTFSIIFGFLLFVLLWILSPIIASFFKSKELIPILRAISVVLLITSAKTTLLGIMYRNLQFKKLSLIQITSYFLGYGLVGIILAILGFGVWSLVIAVICQAILSLFLYLYYSRDYVGISFNKKSFKSLLYFGGGYSLGRIFTFIGNKGDTIIIGKFLDVSSLGLYERGYQLVRSMANLMGEVIDKALFSPMAKKQNDRSRLGVIYLEITYILSIILMPLSIFMYQNSKSIVRILLGPQWDSSVPIAEAMSISLFFLLTTKVGNTLAKSVGEVYNRALRNLIMAIMIIIGAYIGTFYGITEVAYIVSLIIIINYFFAFTQINNITNIGYLNFFKTHIVGIISACVCFCLSYFVNLISSLFKFNIYIDMLINGLIYLLVFLMTIFIFDSKKIVLKYLHFMKLKNK